MAAICFLLTRCPEDTSIQCHALAFVMTHREGMRLSLSIVYVMMPDVLSRVLQYS